MLVCNYFYKLTTFLNVVLLLSNQIIIEDMDGFEEKINGSYNSSKEPSVMSDDPEERKLARRLRIQKRLDEAARLQAIKDGTYNEPETEQHPLDGAIEKTEDVLEILFLEGRDLVSNVRVASDAREVERRETEFRDRNNRLKMLEEEAALALKKLNEITNKWELMQEANDPLNLYDHMKEQKEKCLELIQQKNDLIKNFQTELKLADEKFMKDRRKIYVDLALLTQRIDEQVLVMKRAYRQELLNIDDVIDSTRSKVMADYQKVWQSLYNQREKEELSNMAKKFTMVENHEDEMEERYKEHEEKYREARIKLETDVQTLEQELERVKAFCLLNSEKLDYNYQVLKRREEENIYIKNHQKRKLNKLQDVVNTLKKKIEEKQDGTEIELKRLQQEVMRYQGNVIDIGKKSSHFSQMNEDTYQEIWDMKDQEAREKLDKILSIDKIIYEQVLGIPWKPPELKLVSKTELPSYASAKKVVTELFSKSDEVKHNINLGEGDMPDGKNDEFEEGHRRLLRQILGLIADQSGFLVEEKLDELLKPYSIEEKTLVRLDNVFAAIGIETERDVDLMKNIFLPYAICPLCDAVRQSEQSIVQDVASEGTREESHRTASQTVDLVEKVSKLISENSAASLGESVKTEDKSGRKEKEKDNVDAMQLFVKDEPTAKIAPFQCNITHPLVIEKIYVLNALKDFVKEFHPDSCRVRTGMSELVTKKRNTISRLITDEDVEMYWNLFKQVFSEERQKLWDAMLFALSRYHALLQERHRLNLRAQKLRNQNLELRRLLARYVSDNPDNNQLLLPRLTKSKKNVIDMEHLPEIITKLKV